MKEINSIAAARRLELALKRKKNLELAIFTIWRGYKFFEVPPAVTTSVLRMTFNVASQNIGVVVTIQLVDCASLRSW